MITETMSTPTKDSHLALRNKTEAAPLICWKSTIAGLALALITYIGALSLATAFGGIGLSDGATAQNAGIFAGVALALATVIATFVGGYFAVRVAKTKVDMLGSAQGLLVGAIFLSFVVFQVFSVAGVLGSAAAQTLGATAAVAGSGAVAASDSPVVREIVEDNFGALNLRSEPSVVIQGVASRLIRGDNEAAKNYLAGQAGISPTEADERIAVMQSRIDEAATQARVATATALKTTGWSLFVVICLGLITALLGGLAASVYNVRATLDARDTVVTKTSGRQIQAHA